jgi:glycosyltransferase involved in cell wall biosynthesis
LKRKGVRIVWTAHELFPPDDGRWIDAVGYAICARAADLCICHGSLARHQLTRRFAVPQRKILTLPIGTYAGVLPAPRERAGTNERFGLPDGARLLVCFGDLRPRKGIEVALRAAQLLGDEYALVVAGRVPVPVLLPWAERLQRTPAARNTRIVVERLPDQVLADLLGAADCVLLPYLHIFGSSALSLSLASGRGVVASALPYFSEVLSLEPDAGVLAAPGDPDALACAVREFFAKPLAQRHAAASRLGARLAWPDLVRPVAHWLIRNVGQGDMRPAKPETPPLTVAQSTQGTESGTLDVSQSSRY